jgi:peroxiredoxin
MTRRTLLVGALALASCTAKADDHALKVGDVAPPFELVDLAGTTHKLSDHVGKTVVLEWFNPGCPYVVDTHTEGGALFGVAKEAAAQGVVWLAINSGAKGKQGHDPDENRQAKQAWGLTHPILLDPDGAVGQAYGARSTPHLYVIDPQGVVQYEGAVDNQPMRQATGDRVPYLEHAIADVVAGKRPRTPRTRPYGCSVKY